MRSFLFPALLLSATICLSQRQNDAQDPHYDKAVQWVDIHVPTFPPLARQARIFGTVAIEVRFDGCELVRESLRVVSGHRMLTEAALQSLKQSTLQCGDFPNATATVYYEFVNCERPGCDTACPRVEVFGSHVRVGAAPACVEP
ncbi:MAG: hypothetical protein JOZ80_09395 [Acidobacteriaceae bacterium]|nr:hypothetical protein [Acidobacteriaceae bacterium]